MILDIVKYPDPRLFAVSQPVKELTPEIENLIDSMFETQKHLWHRAVGLAAPQVGHNIRLFIAKDVVYINPEMLWKSPEGQIMKEGCFSLEQEKMDYGVWRSYSVKLRWMNRKGQIRMQTFTGYIAEIIQHEYDHLEGKLCSGVGQKKPTEERSAA